MVLYYCTLITNLLFFFERACVNQTTRYLTGTVSTTIEERIYLSPLLLESEVMDGPPLPSDMHASEENPPSLFGSR